MRTLIIGLDGATWDVMDPLIHQGRLPNISRLMGEGAYGTLISLEGYISPALWATIDTGKIPEKHGVLDFYDDSKEHVKATRIFDILAGDTGKIGLFRWYSTYPPNPNQGFTIPSSMAPGPDTFPKELEFITRLRSINNMKGYVNVAATLLMNGVRMSSLISAAKAAIYRMTLGSRHPGAYYHQLFAEARIYTDVFARLARDYDPDFAAILFYYIDAIEHRYWKYIDPGAFVGVDAAKVRKYNHVIPSAYVLADELIGRILRYIPRKATVVVVSDHGQKAAAEEEKGVGYRPKSEIILRELGLYDDVYPTVLCNEMILRSVKSKDEVILDHIQELFENISIKETGLPLYEVRQPGDRTIRVRLRLAHINAAAHVLANKTVLFGNGRKVALKDVVDLSSGETFENLSGAHAINGIFIIRGENVKKNFRSPDAKLVDIVPTLLALNRKPVGRDMDGEVLEGIIESEFLRTNPVTYVDSYDIHLDDERPMPKVLTDDERKMLEDRLRALGYL